MDLWRAVAEYEAFDTLESVIQLHYTNDQARRYLVHFRNNLTSDIRKLMRSALPCARNYNITKKESDRYLVSFDIRNRRFKCTYSVIENMLINKQVLDVT